jgi:hypothetical protein
MMYLLVFSSDLNLWICNERNAFDLIDCEQRRDGDSVKREVK